MRRTPSEIMEKLRELPELQVSRDREWASLSSLGIGLGKPILAEPSDDGQLRDLLEFCSAQAIPVFYLGAGSNLLGTDSPLPVVVLKLSNSFFKGFTIREGKIVSAGAGLALNSFFRQAAEKQLGGGAPLAGIPGTLGGAITMNAGAIQTCIGDFVREIRGFHRDGTPWRAGPGEIHWDYRCTSIPQDVIVTEAVFELVPADTDEEKRLIRKSMEWRNKHFPSGRSAGCVFKNPSDEIPAGLLLDRAGIQGFSKSALNVSQRHANYVVNAGNASEKDFLDLMSRMRTAVIDKFNIYLKPEIAFFNADSFSRLLSPPPPRVVVLKGGNSTEREISLQSGHAVAVALKEAGYTVKEFDIKKPDVAPFFRDAEIVFPVLHGGFGEDGTLQKLMEERDIEFVGCGSAAASLVMDKIRSKKMMDDAKIPTAPWCVIKHDAIGRPPPMNPPFVLKPPLGGSTVGIHILRHKDQYTAALQDVLKYGDSALAEKYVQGVEFTIGIVDGETMPAVEISFPGDTYDYDAKYTHTRGETKYLCPPENLGPEVLELAEKAAKDFYKASGARDLLRVDMIYSDSSGLCVLEGNSMPGFTASSLLPKAAAETGMPFTVLCAKLVSLAQKRKNMEK